MKEWDIPYDELKLFEKIGEGRFGTVYRGSWHGAVAVKLLHVHSLSDDCAPLDTFKHEVTVPCFFLHLRVKPAGTGLRQQYTGA
jgi:kinase suppressor of Ras 2